MNRSINTEGTPIMPVSLIHQQREADQAMEAHYNAQCNCPLTTGPTHDPYGTSCDLPKGHEGDHSGPCPFGSDEPMTWTQRRGARELLRKYE